MSIVTVSSTEFTLLAVGDAIIQNVGSAPIRLVFDTSLPLATAKGFVLADGQGFQVINGLPTGNAYAICAMAGKTSDVAVGE